MGVLNCLRSCAYLMSSSIRSFIAPRTPAPSLSRPRLRMLKAILWPLPGSPSRFSTGTFASSKMSAQVDEPRMPILCSSRPTLHDEPGELLPIDLREHDVDVRERRVGDELLRAVEDPVLAVGREHRL